MTDTLLLPSKVEHRDRLYYDQYQYALSFYCADSYALRENTLVNVLARIRQRQMWTGWSDEDTKDISSRLETVYNALTQTIHDIKYTVGYNTVNVYANSTAELDRIIKQCWFIKRPHVRCAEVDRPKDTVVLKNPKFKLRTYLKAQWVDETRKSQLSAFFKAQEGLIEPCGAFKRFVTGTTPRNYKLKDRWLPDHFYVEYDNPLYLTMLVLILPASNRKTLDVIQRINS